MTSLHTYEIYIYKFNAVRLTRCRLYIWRPVNLKIMQRTCHFSIIGQQAKMRLTIVLVWVPWNQLTNLTRKAPVMILLLSMYMNKKQNVCMCLVFNMYIQYITRDSPKYRKNTLISSKCIIKYKLSHYVHRMNRKQNLKQKKYECKWPCSGLRVKSFLDEAAAAAAARARGPAMTFVKTWHIAFHIGVMQRINPCEHFGTVHQLFNTWIFSKNEFYQN